MSAENIVIQQQQQQLLASVMPGQLRSRRGGIQPRRKKPLMVFYGVCVCVYKRSMHCKAIRMDK